MRNCLIKYNIVFSKFRRIYGFCRDFRKYRRIFLKNLTNCNPQIQMFTIDIFIDFLSKLSRYIFAKTGSYCFVWFLNLGCYVDSLKSNSFFFQQNILRTLAVISLCWHRFVKKTVGQSLRLCIYLPTYLSIHQSISSVYPF